ncbi:MAG: guanylate kinase [Muribaculaceae bacterium]|nr:guanylate kinase [Muribaculaceae bacterium]
MQDHNHGRLIILSAPSGSGKSTIINAMLKEKKLPLTFAVSATNRPPRPGEKDGVHYHFLSTEEFQDAITRKLFVEYEEVYPGRYYGTLRSELDSRLAKGEHVILDLDVCGGINVKKQYGASATSIFIMPPSTEALKERLTSRGTETPETLQARLQRAEYEISLAPQFDHCVINDVLENAVDQTTEIVNNALLS